MTPTSPTIRRKRLSNALLSLRRDNDLTADQVARKLGWDPSKISRIESNEWKLPRVADIEALCDIYKVAEDTREALVTLARQARQRGWWEEFKDVLGESMPGLEIEATRIRHFQPMLIPGLLQTPDYTRAICRAGLCTDAETERRVAARVTRQGILHRDEPPVLWVVLDESALRKLVGGREVMRDQVHHLLHMADRPNIGVQILLDSVGAHAGMSGPIVLLDYHEAPTIAYVEHAGTGDLYLESPEEIAGYTLQYANVMASAISTEASMEYLQQLLENLKGEGS